MLTFGNFRRFSRKNNIYVILIQRILLYSFCRKSRRATSSDGLDISPYLMNDTVEILFQLHQKESLIVNPRRRNGIILIKAYHAEFAGPGSVIGGEFDTEVVRVLAVGNLSLLQPQSSEEKIKAYLIRRQWILLTKQIADNPTPQQRAQIILNQFENWFDAAIASQVCDEAFSLLVGVLPKTIASARREIENF
jgi:hypothetical protein